MKNKKVYFKELEEIGKYKVWLVDGEYIRKEMNENFVGYDNNAHLSFIPKDELWIDKCANPSEYHFFIDHFINEIWAMNNGESYEKAMEKANILEKKERKKFIHLENNKNKTPSSKEILEKIHKKLIYDCEELKIWLVDGKAVRDYIFVEYAEGGHDRVYSFIPKGEIWLEETLSPRERKFIILHELHERYLMGQGKDYAHAHRGATIVEDHYRDYPQELDSRIEEEIKKNCNF